MLSQVRDIRPKFPQDYRDPIVGNYLTTLGRPAELDIDMFDELKMPVKVLSKSL